MRVVGASNILGLPLFNPVVFLSLVDLCLLPFQCPSKEAWEKGIKKDRKTHTTAAVVAFTAGVFFQSPRWICGAIPALVKRLCHGSSRMGSSV
jgi:hypothetical protein